MAFPFSSRLILVCPIGKRSCLNRTLEAGLTKSQVPDRVRYWFPVMDRMILNTRQGKLRAYHSLPRFFLLFYQEASGMDRGQKWRNVCRIKVYRDCIMELYDYETGETYRQ